MDAALPAADSNIGYNYKLPGDWFIEPSAGVNWSRAFVDPLNVSTIIPLLQ